MWVFCFFLFRLIGAYDSLVRIVSTQVFLYEYIFFVHSAPIGDKTRKPKLLKPQPRKLVLVSTRHQQYNSHSACSAIVYFDALLFFSWKLGVANHCTSQRCFANSNGKKQLCMFLSKSTGMPCRWHTIHIFTTVTDIERPFFSYK